MKTYYYDLQGPQGPVSEEQLHQLYQKNTLSLQSPIIPHGEASWTTYGKLFPPSSSKFQLAGFFTLNTKIDHFLKKKLPLPSCLSTPDKRAGYFEQMANLICHLLWIYIMLVVARIAPDSIAFWCFLASVLIGFIIQKPLYHLYLLNTLIISQAKPAELLSPDFPRFYAFLHICFLALGIILFGIFVCTSTLTGPLMFALIAIGLALLSFFYLSAVINLHAEPSLLRIHPEKMSASMNFLYHLKYFNTQFCLVLQILSPLLIACAFIISFIASPLSISWGSLLNPWSLLPHLQTHALILAPFICGFAFYATSLVLDFIIHLCSTREQDKSSPKA